MTGQLRRAVVSVPTNVAESCGRNSDGDIARFLEISMGSASEVEYLLLLARDWGYWDEGTYERYATGMMEIKRMLAGLIMTLKTKLTADR